MKTIVWCWSFSKFPTASYSLLSLWQFSSEESSLLCVIQWRRLCGVDRLVSCVRSRFQPWPLMVSNCRQSHLRRNHISTPPSSHAVFKSRASNTVKYRTQKEKKENILGLFFGFLNLIEKKKQHLCQYFHISGQFEFLCSVQGGDWQDIVGKIWVTYNGWFGGQIVGGI